MASRPKKSARADPRSARKVRRAPRRGARRHAQGRVAVSRRRRAQDLARRRPALPRPHHQPSGARPARRAHAAGGGEDRPPRPDRVSLHRPRPHLEGSRAAARVREGAGRREGPRGRSHVLAHAGPRERAGRLVRGHLAAGTVPLRGRRRHAGSRSPRINDDPQYREVDGHRAGRHAGRAEAALDHRRPARSRASVLRHVGRRRARVGRRRPQLGRRS